MKINLVLKILQRSLILIGLLGMPFGPLLAKISWWLPLLTWSCLAFGILLSYVRRANSKERALADRIATLTLMAHFLEANNPKSRWEIYLDAVNDFVILPTMKRAAWVVDAFDQADTNYAIHRDVVGKALVGKITELRKLLSQRAVLPTFIYPPH